jgi:autotransporter passenger strand-loop-strand repeat protein
LADDGTGGTLVFLSAATTVTSGQTLTVGGTTGSSQALASQPLAALTLPGQTLDGVDVLSGGTYLVKSDGMAIKTTVDGDTFNIQGGGVADTTAINTGVMNVSAGGIAIGITISSGGHESVAGTDLGGIVDDGGTQAVLSGGFASGTLLNDPGTQIVSSGGTAAGVVISGGAQEVSNLPSAFPTRSAALKKVPAPSSVTRRSAS